MSRTTLGLISLPGRGAQPEARVAPPRRDPAARPVPVTLRNSLRVSVLLCTVPSIHRMVTGDAIAAAYSNRASPVHPAGGRTAARTSHRLVVGSSGTVGRCLDRRVRAARRGVRAE